MPYKKLLTLSISIVLSCGYVEVAHANSACQDKFSSTAFGNLEKSDLDRLKKEYVAARRPIKSKERNPLYDYEVKMILGFSGEQTKTASNGRIEQRIWIERDNCKRKIKASFRDSQLVQLKSYGF